MKKLFSVIIAVAMIASLFAFNASAAEIIDADDLDIVGANIDDFVWTCQSGNTLSAAASAVTDFPGWLNNFRNGNALGVNGYQMLASFESVMFRGWIGFDQEIETFGYLIEGEEPVLDQYQATYCPATEDAVKEAGNGGQYGRRYAVTIPITKAGLYDVFVVAKLADGRIVKLNSEAVPTADCHITINAITPDTSKTPTSIVSREGAGDNWAGMSFDKILWNYANITESGKTARESIDQYAAADGSFDLVGYSGISVCYIGWFAATQPIAAFGYVINDQAVIGPEFASPNEDGLVDIIQGWGGAFANSYIQRFCIYVPIHDLKGTNTVCAAVQLQDGTVVKMDDAGNANTVLVLKGPEEEQQGGEDPVHEGGLRDFDKNKGDHMSYDQILVNGAEIANGNDAVIANKALVDGSDGHITSVAMHGWYGNDSAKIVSYGYMIDGGEPVYGDFTVDCEPEVIQAGGESRFTITIDVTGLKDGKEHKIQAVAKMDNGDIVKLNRFEDGKDRDAYVNYKAQLVEEPHTDPVPQTGDATVALISIVAVISLAAVVIFRKRAF